MFGEALEKNPAFQAYKVRPDPMFPILKIQLTTWVRDVRSIRPPGAWHAGQHRARRIQLSQRRGKSNGLAQNARTEPVDALPANADFGDGWNQPARGSASSRQA